jgi:WD40 repeat protein
MAFSQDGDTLATSAGADDAAVRLWHVRDRRSPVPGVVLAVNSALTLAFSPAGDVLVAGGVLGDLHAWNVTDPDNPVALDTDTSSGADKPAFTAVAFRPDGTSFVAADDSAAVSVGVRQRGEHPEDSLVLMSAGLVGQGGEQTVAFSPDGRHLLTGDRNGGVDLWTTPLPILSGGIGPDDQHGTTFNSDGTLVVSNADPQSPTDRVRLWELDTSSRPTLAATLPSQWKHAAFLSDGRTLLAEKPLGDTLGLWDIADPRHPRLAATIAETEQKHAADQAELGSPESATNRDGLLAVSLRSGAGVQLWNIHDARHPALVTTIELDAGTAGGSPESVRAMWFLDDTTLGMITDDLHLWDLRDPRHPRQSAEPINPGNASGFVFVGSTRLLLAPNPIGAGTTAWSLADIDHPVNLLEKGSTDNGKPTSIDADPGGIVYVDDRTFVAGAQNNQLIQVWDLSDAEHPTVRSSLATASTTGSLASDADGHFLASAGFADGTEHIWTLSGADEPTIADFADVPATTFLAFSPDGRSLAADLPVTAGSGVLVADGATGFAVWPTDLAPVYHRLCSIRRGVHDLHQYQPAQYFRPACQ